VSPAAEDRTPGGDGGKKEHLVMEHLVSITYREQLAPNLDRYLDALMDGRLLGQRCPRCRRVYVPGKGYCPLCVVEMGARDEEEVSDHGVVTAFTIITPVAYYGQEETEPFVYSSVLLDGVDSTLGGQDIVGVPHGQIRAGMRVKAVWRPKSERSAEGVSNRGWGSVGGAIEAFEPTGEPDVPREQYAEHIF
jgi:uncharacterized OB-fold protein